MAIHKTLPQWGYLKAFLCCCIVFTTQSLLFAVTGVLVTLRQLAFLQLLHILFVRMFDNDHIDKIRELFPCPRKRIRKRLAEYVSSTIQIGVNDCAVRCGIQSPEPVLLIVALVTGRTALS